MPEVSLSRTRHSVTRPSVVSVEEDRARRLLRVLAAVVGVGLAALGAAELVARLGDPWPLLFWLPTLWGGAALVWVGAFALPVRSRLSRPLVIAGAVLGLLPSAWTVVMPVLSIGLVVTTLQQPGKDTALPTDGG
jgi:hypothetical protein